VWSKTVTLSILSILSILSTLSILSIVSILSILYILSIRSILSSLSRAAVALTREDGPESAGVLLYRRAIREARRVSRPLEFAARPASEVC
jgi:hypothetical protein